VLRSGFVGRVVILQLAAAASIGRLASRVAPGRHFLGFLLRSGSGRGVTLHWLGGVFATLHRTAEKSGRV